MTPYPFDQAIVWHVVFHPGKSLWGRRFRHVSLAGYADDTWLHLDVQRGGVNVATIYRHDEVQDYLTFLLTYFTVVRFGTAKEWSRAFFTPMTCVSFVKHALGVRSGALRPDSLFASLVSDFDVEVLNDAADAAGNADPESAEDQRSV